MANESSIRVVPSKRSNDQTWMTFIAELEKQIQSGKQLNLIRIVKEIKPRSVPRKFSCSIAKLAVRLNQPLVSLGLLQKIIYPENQLEEPARLEEVIHYASTLTSLGVVNESIVLLKKYLSTKDYNIHHQLARAYVADWNYVRALYHYKKILNFEKIPDYYRAIINTNLISTMIAVRQFKKAENLLNKNIIYCKARNYLLLLGNAYELQSQIYILTDRFDLAEISLNQAKNILANTGGRYLLYVEKWEAILRYKITLNTLKNQNLKSDPRKIFETVKARAFSLKDWSTVRECDLYLAKINSDESLFNYIMIGTPSLSYRKHAAEVFGRNSIVKGRQTFFLNRDEKQLAQETFDLTKQWSLMKTPMLYHFLKILFKDFYQPVGLGALFMELFPQEKFHPLTSPARIFRLQQRLNHWLIKTKAHFYVTYRSREFMITSKDQVRVILTRGLSSNVSKLKYDLVRESVGSNSFDLDQLMSIFKCSRAAAQRWVSSEIKSNRLTKDKLKRHSYKLMSPNHPSRFLKNRTNFSGRPV